MADLTGAASKTLHPPDHFKRIDRLLVAPMSSRTMSAPKMVKMSHYAGDDRFSTIDGEGIGGVTPAMKLKMAA
ncbi:hypothetical protein [Rhodovulum sulfidophilum]|uniref:hypothetical protein n=1 Tax=Rhodovulum sulfidophilum TaxID=35806 RepID=UPI0009535AF6|nr:hypothetical protein [Rhodovulum sulfidophilum]OLS52675.1 hypothetical protein BV392_12170 [Rhodovulum sulfidophilum]